MSEESHQPSPLEYASPVRRAPPAASPVSAVLGVICGLFGVLMLVYGVLGVIWLVRDRRRVGGGDVFEVVMISVIGVFCTAVAVRWIRAGLRTTE